MGSRWLALAVFVTLVIMLSIICCVTHVCCPAADVTQSESQQPSSISDALRPPAAAQAAAEKGLKTLRLLGRGDDKEAKLLGFESASEKTAGELGDPLPIFWVSPRKLQKFKRSDPTDLLELPNRFIYPVTVGKNKDIRSSLTVKRLQTDKGTWKAVEFGARNFVRLLAEYKKQSDANAVVWISGLSRHFLARLSEARLVSMTPIADDPILGLKAGQALSPNTVFEKLQEVEARALERAQKRRPGQRGLEKQGGKK